MNIRQSFSSLFWMSSAKLVEQRLSSTVDDACISFSPGVTFGGMFSRSFSTGLSLSRPGLNR